MAITGNLLKKYGVSVDELYEAAIRNMDEISLSSFKNMRQIMAEMMGEDFSQRCQFLADCKG